MTLFGQPRPRVREAARPKPGVKMPEVGPRSGRSISGSEEEVNPTHYSGDLVMRVIEERGLDFALGNTVKYVCRAGSKGDKLTDLKKALWYLERAITKEEAAK